jgi:hypothetical protein
VGAVHVECLGGYRGSVFILLVPLEAAHEIRGVDGLQDAECVERVLLLEAVGLPVGLLQSFADLDGLGREECRCPGNSETDGPGV